MINYFFSFDRPNNLVNITINIDSNTETALELQLPCWRPGRYQIQNFAKNILNFNAIGSKKHLKWKKTATHTWQVETQGNESITIKYAYYANELNAGTSSVSQEMIYLNPVNLCMFLSKKIDAAFNLTIIAPEENKIATGLPFEKTDDGFKLKPNSYYQLYDCPIIISNHLQKYTFEAAGVPFYFWVLGNFTMDVNTFIADITKVAEYQIDFFGKFPELDYHFMLIIPPHSYYHGVEHANSTMMVLSEQGELGDASYVDLLGLTSHELFHTWNIIKIRPKELLPYDYTQENYFETCFVAEGYTTYYGDRILFDSGVFTKEQYRFELETILRRHFDNNDDACQSLLESSFDLWLDGYEKGIPNKKVSVYHKGALATLILDYKIRLKFSEQKSMKNVMNKLYAEFGDLSKGYTYLDIQRICEEVYEDSLQNYFSTIIEGNNSIFAETKEALAYFGFIMEKEDKTIKLSFLD